MKQPTSLNQVCGSCQPGMGGSSRDHRNSSFRMFSPTHSTTDTRTSHLDLGAVLEVHSQSPRLGGGVASTWLNDREMDEHFGDYPVLSLPHLEHIAALRP